jgi:hypothetical protein
MLTIEQLYGVYVKTKGRRWSLIGNRGMVERQESAAYQRAYKAEQRAWDRYVKARDKGDRWPRRTS